MSFPACAASAARFLHTRTCMSADPTAHHRSPARRAPSRHVHRLAGVAALAAGALCLAGAAGTGDPHPGAPSLAPRTAAADTLRDSALATGTLPNGLHYYLRPNRSPAHRAEFRLVVNAGSMLEDDDQQGFAHFLEHMAFNGTKHFPHGELVDFIETSGMKFGADLNAETTADETIYQFKLPTDDSATVRRGLDILYDWASGDMTIDSSEVVRERGVVMSEWRLRSLVDTVTHDYLEHYDSLWYGASRYFRRQPIGDTALIETAQPAPIRRFYHDWYRPDLMAIVVVGDFNRQRMLGEIVKRFGAIPARSNPRPRLESMLHEPREPLVDVYRGSVSPSVELLWPAPSQPENTDDAFRQQLVQRLFWQQLEHRLLAIRERPSRPFITATLEQGRVVRPIHLTGFSVVAEPDSLARGLATVLTEIQRIAQHGVPGEVLDHEKAMLLRNLEEAAGSAIARPSSSFADEYAEHFLTGDGTMLSPAQELALGRRVLPAITSEVLAHTARDLWSERARRIFVRLPRFAHVRPPTRQSILALVDSVGRTAIPAERATVAKESPLLAQLPTPGRITGETRDTVAGTTTWTLSNGAKVIVKPTTNDPDEVLLRAWSPGGFSRMPDSLFYSPGRMVATLMTAVGSSGSDSVDALSRQLQTTGVHAIKAHIGYADESIDLAASPSENETLFQELYLQLTAPRFDTAMIRSWASLAKYQGNGATVQDQINQIFARGEPRLWPVSSQLADLMRPEEALAAYRNRFGNAGDFTFILVGAITTAQARPLVERYIASLPSTSERETPAPLDVAPFLQKIDNTLRVLELPKAETSILFDGPFPSKPDEYLRARQELDALVSVLQDRIRVRIREELSGSYSPSIFALTYALPEVGQPEEHFRVLGGFTAATERIRTLWGEYAGILDSVRAHGATAHELARAAAIGRRQHETALERNDYWMDAIQRFNRLAIPLGRIVDAGSGPPITPAELQAAARRFTPSDVYIHLTVVPRDSLPDSGAAAGAARAHRH